LAGLVNRQNSEEQNVILPIWHGVTKEDVITFSPPLVDLIALNTTTDEAEEIAFKLLHKIRPDIYNKTERSHLEKLASGGPRRTRQEPIEETRAASEAAHGELAEYRCAHCGAPLSGRNDAPMEEEDRHWGTVESFACAYGPFGVEIQSPYPAGPK